MGMSGNFAPITSTELSRLKENTTLVIDYLYPNDGEDEVPNLLNIDKDWHGIHFMLAGAADDGVGPLSLAVLGGEEFGEDLGMGQARYLTPEQVKEISIALCALGETEFRARFDPQAMNDAEIYPTVIWLRDGQDALNYLTKSYLQLVTFYAETAAVGSGAILWIS